MDRMTRNFIDGDIVTRDYPDYVIEYLADSEDALREENQRLLDLIADLTLENIQLRICWEHELVSRIHGDATIARLRRQHRGE
jgi:hypothetical protein